MRSIMNEHHQPGAAQLQPTSGMDGVIRIAVVLLLAAWCFDIVKPFIIPVVWGVIIAIAAYPFYEMLCTALAGRRCWQRPYSCCSPCSC